MADAGIGGRICNHLNDHISEPLFQAKGADWGTLKTHYFKCHKINDCERQHTPC